MLRVFDLTSRFYERAPIDLGQETLNENRVKFCLPNLKLNVLERKWEVVCVTVFCMASEEIVCYKPNHDRARAMRLAGGKFESICLV